MPIIDRARIAAALPGYVLGRELGAGGFGLVIAGRWTGSGPRAWGGVNRGGWDLGERTQGGVDVGAASGLVYAAPDGGVDVAVKVIDLGIAQADGFGGAGPSGEGGAAAPGPGQASAAARSGGPGRGGAGPGGAVPPGPDVESEAQALTQLDHPHISRVLDVAAVDELRLLVAELLPGGTAARQSLPPPAACAIVLAVADALMHAHAAGILHCGIKPANILFTADGRPKLTDLGVVGLAGRAALAAGQVIGTAQYMAPEQITGGRLGPATDLYALAATLYELLAGAPLFGVGLTTPDLFRHHCEVVPPPPAGVPSPVAGVLARALAKPPGERHRTAAQFAMDLAEAARLGYGRDWLDQADVPLSVSDGLREHGSGGHPALGRPMIERQVIVREGAPGPADLGGPARPAPGPDQGDDPADRTTRLDPPLPAVTSLLSPPAPADPAGPVVAPTAGSRSGGPEAAGQGARLGTPGAGPGSDPAGGGAPASAVLARPDGTGRADGASGTDGAEGSTPRLGPRRHGRRLGLVAAALAAVLTVAAVLVVPQVADDEPAASGPSPTSPLSGPGTASPVPAEPEKLPPPPPYPVVAVAGTGEAAFTGDGGPAGDAALNGPFGMVADWAGNIYVADFDNHRVRRIAADGTITTVAGTGEAGFSGDGGPATRAQLRSPSAVALDAAGNILVADTFNHRVRRINPAGVITTVAGIDDRGFGGDGGPATEAVLWYPGSVVADPNGNIYIADTGNNRIRRIGADGIIHTVAGLDGEGSFGDGGPAREALLAFPISIAMDRAGRLYIADTNNNRVRRIGLDGMIETIAGTGLPGYTGDGGPATEATLRSPRGVAVDPQGNVFITDRNNRRIRRVDPSGIITTVAGTARPGRDATIDPDAMSPDGPVALDPGGDVFVADRRHHRVLHVDLTGSG